MTDLSPEVLALRISISALIGMVLGYERESHGGAAGMRTTMLVCVASTLAMLLSENLYLAAASESVAWRPDPARLAQGVLAGMGFLGAGVILKHDQAIRGVTSAALLWFTAILGMAVGAGYMGLAIAGFTVAMAALFILPTAENYIAPDRYALLTVWTSLSGPEPQRVAEAAQALGLTVHIKSRHFEIDKISKTNRMVFEIKTKKSSIIHLQPACVKALVALNGVKKVSWE